MKRLIFLVILAAIGYGTYSYYLNRAIKLPRVSTKITSTPNISQVNDIPRILGTATSDIIQKGTDLLNSATAGQAEPIINKAVSDLQERVKDLPEQEYKKVKYEFCKDVIPSPSTKELE